MSELTAVGDLDAARVVADALVRLLNGGDDPGGGHETSEGNTVVNITDHVRRKEGPPRR